MIVRAIRIFIMQYGAGCNLRQLSVARSYDKLPPVVYSSPELSTVHNW